MYFFIFYCPNNAVVLLVESRHHHCRFDNNYNLLCCLFSECHFIHFCTFMLSNCRSLIKKKEAKNENQDL
jgi:hypothetical protein